MAQLKDEMIPFLTRQEIKDLVSQLARQIENDYTDKELILICPLRGSILFVSDLSRELKLPNKVDFVSLSSADSKGSVYMQKDVSLDISGKDVLVCEEIIDAGRKLSFLLNRLIASGPSSLRVVALLDKPARRELPIAPDYVGKTIDDRFVVGYGMDSDEKGRNYPDIYLPKN